MKDSNVLIAEFMGLVVSDRENYTSELHTNVDADLKYHTSWDWLMPVVEKIEGLRDSNGDAYRFSIDMCNAQIEGANIEILGGAFKLDTTYRAVVEFIKQHNKKA
tara:strand:- start:2071 stop:2385 length:315 start_codon:yes stop_codon:yes gene_type:complete